MSPEDKKDTKDETVKEKTETKEKVVIGEQFCEVPVSLTVTPFTCMYIYIIGIQISINKYLIAVALYYANFI